MKNLLFEVCIVRIVFKLTENFLLVHLWFDALKSNTIDCHMNRNSVCVCVCECIFHKIQRMEVLINCIYSFTELNSFLAMNSLSSVSCGRWLFDTSTNMWIRQLQVSCCYFFFLEQQQYAGMVLIFHQAMIHALWLNA